MRVVFDAGVVFSGAGWHGEAHRCLLAMARRQVIVTRDADLLALQKPFGIRIITPRELLSLLARPLG